MPDRQLRQPNDELRRVIESTGCTYDQLARLVVRIAAENQQASRATRSSIAKWVGGMTPAGRTGLFVAEALTRLAGRPVTTGDLGWPAPGETDTSGDPITDLIGLGQRDLTHRIDRRAVLFTVAALPLSLGIVAQAKPPRAVETRSARRVGGAEAAAVRSMTSALIAVDELAGGGHGRTAVVQYLITDVAAHLRGRFRRSSDRAEMFSAAAELAYLAGWKCHDLGDEGLAQAYYQRSLRLALEADVPGQAAWVLRIMTHQSLDIGQPQRCVDLATAAWSQVHGRIPAIAEALFAVTAARAQAAAGNHRLARHALDAAQLHLTASTDPPPGWLAVTGPPAATVASHTAKTLSALGDHAGAEAHYRAALAGRDPATHPRIHALTLAKLGHTYAARGNADGALSAWATALSQMTGVSSTRHADEMTAVARVLPAWIARRIPGAADLQQQVAQFLDMTRSAHGP